MSLKKNFFEVVLVNTQLPENMGELSKFARLQKCVASNIESEGSSVCRDSSPVAVGQDDLLFYSSSGNYKVEMRKAYTIDENLVYQVKANPNGNMQ